MGVPKKSRVKPRFSVWQLTKEDRVRFWKWKRIRKCLWRSGFYVARSRFGTRVVKEHSHGESELFPLQTLPIERLESAQNEKFLAQQLQFFPRSCVSGGVIQ